MQRRLLLAGTVVLCCPALLGAQGVPLSRLVSNALASAATIARPLTGSTATAQGDTAGHFYQRALAQPAPAELDAAISTQLTTFPTAFAWGAPQWDGPGGPDARLRGTGSSWVESPATLGKGRITFSAGHEAVEFNGVDGANLRNAELAVWTAHDDCCAPFGATQTPVFERDLLEQRITMDVDRNAYALFGAVGVTDRLDIGVKVPFVDVKMDARVMSRIIRTSTADTYVYGFQTSSGQPQPVPHGFDIVEIANRTTYYRGDATGVGDVLVKAKSRVAGRGDGIAISLGAHLPTGDPDRLLGAGAFRGEASVLLSRTVSRFNPHLNVGYTFAAGGASATLDTPIATGAPTPLSSDLPDVLHVIAGSDWAIHRRVMLGLDVMARRLNSTPRFATESVSIPIGTGVSAPTFTGDTSLTFTGTGSLVQAAGLASARVFFANRVVGTLEVMLPLNKQGLYARTGAVFGLSMGF